MRYDRRTRKQREADASARIAAICLFLAGVCAAVAALTVGTAGTVEHREEELPAAVQDAVPDKLPGEDTPAHGYACGEEDPLYYRITAEDRAALEHIVEGEAGGESYDGKRWVATCLLNAMRLDGLNAAEVRTAYQYAGWSEDVSDETIRAVSRVFDFGDVTHETVLWFYAPKWCDSSWHESQQFVAEIGGHRFFAPWEDNA